MIFFHDSLYYQMEDDFCQILLLYVFFFFICFLFFTN